MRTKIVATIVLLAFSQVSADYFVWPNTDEKVDIPKSESQEIRDPNVGYYIDAKSNKVVGLVNVKNGNKMLTDTEAPKNLNIGSKNSLVPLKGSETMEYGIKEETIKLW